MDDLPHTKENGDKIAKGQTNKILGQMDASVLDT
jgi:hypothetical protein